MEGISMSMIVLVEDKYPSGNTFYQFFVGEDCLGHAKKVIGGFTLLGKKKLRPTVKEAALTMVNDRIASLKTQLIKWEEIKAQIEKE